VKRVYTDERFPGCEIVNFGGGTFEIHENGAKVADFASWETSDGKISEAFAARRARDYFEREASADLASEYAEQLITEGASARAKPEESLAAMVVAHLLYDT